jgi:hypothetical protein
VVTRHSTVPACTYQTGKPSSFSGGGGAPMLGVCRVSGWRRASCGGGGEGTGVFYVEVVAIATTST